MPLPSGYVTTAELETKQDEIKSNYWRPAEIADNETDELIICGEPDDHMIGGWQFWSEDGPIISRTEPDQAEWIAKAKPGYKVTQTKEEILEIINSATNRKSEWEGLKLLDRKTRFLAFAAYHIGREDFVCVQITQSSILKPLEGYLRMTQDFTNMTPGGIYNFRLGLTKNLATSDSGKEIPAYQVTVRPHRSSEKAEVKAIAEAWEDAKDGMWLPRYYMPRGENNVFDGKPIDGVIPPGLPVTAQDEYGADSELKGF